MYKVMDRWMNKAKYGSMVKWYFHGYHALENPKQPYLFLFIGSPSYTQCSSHKWQALFGGEDVKFKSQRLALIFTSLFHHITFLFFSHFSLFMFIFLNFSSTFHLGNLTKHQDFYGSPQVGQRVRHKECVSFHFKNVFS